MTTLEEIGQKVIEGDFSGVPPLVQSLLDQGLPPHEIIDNGLLAGMDVVGVRFKAEEMFIPEVLVSAKAMHAGMDVLRPLLTAGEGKSAGTVILGTVKGDLHDIGKNLVGMMFTGAGFNVVDLGVDQPAEAFVQAAKEHGAQVIAMSALLTTTMKEMGGVVEALSEAGLRDKIKLMVGGAPVSETFAESIGADGYAPDAGTAVEKLRTLLDLI